MGTISLNFFFNGVNKLLSVAAEVLPVVSDLPVVLQSTHTQTVLWL